MGDRSARREVLLLVLTHTLAFVVPVIPLIPSIRSIVRGAPGIQAILAESYSARVAGFEVAVGDDRAGAAALRRHVDRLTEVRSQLVAHGSQTVDLNLLDGDICNALMEIAFLAETEERDARVEEAAACRHKAYPRSRPMDARRVLDLGRIWVGVERGSE